jgi:AraC-like DNA-binding protein
MIRRDDIDHWAIGVTLHGTVTTRTASGACIVAGPGQPFIWSMGEANDGARGMVDWAVLFVPRDVVPELSDTLDARGGMVLDSPLGGLFADYLCALLRRLPETGEEDRPAIAGATRAMLSACVLTMGSRAALARSTFDGVAYARAIRAIRANLGSATLGPATLSRMVGMSRSALYRAFERHGGVAARIQRERLLAARAALVDPEDRRPVQAIGEACGFPDPSTFSRAFRRMFGCTPREARLEASLVNASCRMPVSPAAGARGDLFSMLRTL